MKYWELVADKLSKAGWSWGCVATIDSNGRTIFVADAHRDDGKRFVVGSDERLAAFLELERITHELAPSALLGDDTKRTSGSRLIEEDQAPSFCTGDICRRIHSGGLRPVARENHGYRKHECLSL